MPEHRRHTPQELADSLEHVVYEIWKYRQSVADYDRIFKAGGDAAIEFRVLHHRVLLEFFHEPRKHKDNIAAGDFIDDWSRTHDGATLPWLKPYMNRCHTMLAHISTTRSDMAKRGLKRWGGDWKVVEPHLDSVIAEFLKGLSEEHRMICRAWVSKWMNEALKDVAGWLA